MSVVSFWQSIFLRSNNQNMTKCLEKLWFDSWHSAPHLFNLTVQLVHRKVVFATRKSPESGQEASRTQPPGYVARTMDQQAPTPFGGQASKLETPPPNRAAMTGLLLTFRFCFTHSCRLLASRGMCCYYCLGIQHWILDSGVRFTSRSRFCPCFRCHLYDQCLGRLNCELCAIHWSFPFLSLFLLLPLWLVPGVLNLKLSGIH